MKLTFTNKKENKNCLYFIRALHEIQKHTMKDNRKPVYIYACKQQLRLAPNLDDIHNNSAQDSCLVILKADTYSIVLDQNVMSKTFLIHSSKLLRSFTKNDSKIVLIELKTTNKGITIEYQSDNADVICFLNIQAEQINNPWPEHPLSTRENNYESIKVCKLFDSQIKDIDMKNEEEIWIQFIEGGVILRTSNNTVRKEGKVLFKQQTEYNFITIKNKLQNRQFINLKGDYFLDHLWRCLKKKRVAILHIKNIYDRYLENQLHRSYIVLQTKVQYGTIFKIVGCFLSEKMGKEGEEAIRRNIKKQREAPRESHLLKSEQNSQNVKNIVLNRFNQIDGEAMIAEEVFRQRRPLGKIEEGQETFTRKFHSRY